MCDVCCRNVQGCSSETPLWSGLNSFPFLFNIVFTELFIDIVCQASVWHIVDMNIGKLGSFPAPGQQKNISITIYLSILLQIESTILLAQFFIVFYSV